MSGPSRELSWCEPGPVRNVSFLEGSEQPNRNAQLVLLVRAVPLQTPTRQQWFLVVEGMQKRGQTTTVLHARPGPNSGSDGNERSRRDTAASLARGLVLTLRRTWSWCGASLTGKPWREL